MLFYAYWDTEIILNIYLFADDGRYKTQNYNPTAQTAKAIPITDILTLYYNIIIAVHVI